MEVVSESENMDRKRFETILNSAADGLKEDKHVLLQVSKLPEIVSERGRDVDLKDVVTVSGFVLENFSEDWGERGIYNLQENVQYIKGELKDLRKEDFENMLKDYAGTKLVMTMKPVLDEYEGDFEPLRNYLCDLVDRAVGESIDKTKESYEEIFQDLKEREEDFEKMYR